MPLQPGTTLGPYMDRVIGEILDAGTSSKKEEKLLLSMRVHQLDFDADRADQRARIEALLKAHGGAVRLDPD